MDSRAYFYIHRHLLYEFMATAAVRLETDVDEFGEFIDAAQWVGIYDVRTVTSTIDENELCWTVQEVDLDLFLIGCEAPQWVLQHLQQAHALTTHLSDGQFTTD